ncbi:hypothetical protein [Pseudoroseicyclus tamaricis]|uniref:Uncharacterized protein n=2 Tax=Pseudoroseicyclus tamaricis TaxID=2705421 RepID=A0A6B2JL93_9RHOB|nr:hypothetical protein [Pseudoroseicyclus tamaricis]NDV02321.1 hypothetical protein [Pseudoroseicyclus tamaricis]
MIRLRCWLCVVAGLALALAAHQIEPTTWAMSGDVTLQGRVLSLAALTLVLAGGIPLFQRGLWRLMDGARSAVLMEKWQRRCDGRAGPLLTRLYGIDRNGQIAP